MDSLSVAETALDRKTKEREWEARNRYALAEAWPEVLTTTPLHLFATLTYSQPVKSYEKVQRDVIRWRRSIVRAHVCAANENGNKEPKSFKRAWMNNHHYRIPYIACCEPHRSKDLHAHVALGYSPDQGVWEFKTLREQWVKRIRFGGRCHFSIIKSPKAVAAYAAKCARYLTKDDAGELWWDGLHPREQLTSGPLATDSSRSVLAN